MGEDDARDFLSLSLFLSPDLSPSLLNMQLPLSLFPWLELLTAALGQLAGPLTRAPQI